MLEEVVTEWRVCGYKSILRKTVENKNTRYRRKIKSTSYSYSNLQELGHKSSNLILQDAPAKVQSLAEPYTPAILFCEQNSNS